MENERFRFAVLFPLLAVITVVVLGGGLGVTFMLLYETSWHEWGVIGLGMLLVVGVPVAAALVQRAQERK